MRRSCAMMSPRVTSPKEEEGADVDRAEQDGAEWEGGAVESDCRDRNYSSLCLTVAQSMAHMTRKRLEKGKGIEKWHRTRMIAEGKLSLSRIAVSLYTSKIERMKCEGKSIVRCFNKESKNQARGSVIEL